MTNFIITISNEFYFSLLVSFFWTFVAYTAIPIIARIIDKNISRKSAHWFSLINSIIIGFIFILIRSVVGSDSISSSAPFIYYFINKKILYSGQKSDEIKINQPINISESLSTNADQTSVDNNSIKPDVITLEPEIQFGSLANGEMPNSTIAKEPDGEVDQARKLVCLSCGSINDENSLFCAHCGTHIKNSDVICEKCGLHGKRNNNYCPSCGTKYLKNVIDLGSRNYAKSVNQTSSKYKYWKIISMITIIVVCFCLIITYLVYDENQNRIEYALKNQLSYWNLEFTSPTGNGEYVSFPGTTLVTGELTGTSCVVVGVKVEKDHDSKFYVDDKIDRGILELKLTNFTINGFLPDPAVCKEDCLRAYGLYNLVDRYDITMESGDSIYLLFVLNNSSDFNKTFKYNDIEITKLAN